MEPVTRNSNYVSDIKCTTFKEVEYGCLEDDFIFFIDLSKTPQLKNGIFSETELREWVFPKIEKNKRNEIRRYYRERDWKMLHRKNLRKSMKNILEI